VTERARKVREDRQVMRQQIIRVAREIFGRSGYRAATTRAIAAGVGIDISTLAHHMGSKGQIYKTVLESIYDEHLQLLERAVARLKGVPLDHAVGEIIDGTLTYLFEHPEVPRLLLFATLGLDVEKGGAPKSHYIPRLLNNVRSEAEKLWGEGVGDKTSFDVLCMAMINLMATFVAGAPFQAASLGVKPDGDVYRQLVGEAMKSLFVPVAKRRRASRFHE